MGQKERVREIVGELFEFSGNTRLSPSDVMAAAKVSAEQAKPFAAMGAGVYWLSDVVGDDGSLAAAFKITGPGKLMELMRFCVTATPREAGGGSKVALDVGDFIFEKGSFGMKPTINAKSTMVKYVHALRGALA